MFMNDKKGANICLAFFFEASKFSTSSRKLCIATTCFYHFPTQSTAAKKCTTDQTLLPNGKLHFGMDWL